MKPWEWKRVPTSGNSVEIMEFTGVSGGDRGFAKKIRGMTGWSVCIS